MVEIRNDILLVLFSFCPSLIGFRSRDMEIGAADDTLLYTSTKASD